MAQQSDTETWEFLKSLAKNLVVDKALEPTDPLYVRLYDTDPADPISLIFRDIKFNEVESLNFLSGFRGTGKTTELFRLRQMLKEANHFVVYANALEYIPPSEPVDISDFLIVLAGAFSDALENQLGLKLEHEGWWTRFVHYLSTTNVSLDGFDFQAGVPGTNAGMNMKFSLREASSFRQLLREKMSTRLGELRKLIREFFAFGIAQLQEKHGRKQNVVFIFDQLEQLRDTLGKDGPVAESVAALIANHRQDLKIPSVHMVLTVPPWLKFKLTDLTNIRLLYNVMLWHNNLKRTPYDRGLITMREVVGKRFTPAGMIRFFGTPDPDGTFPKAEKLIYASGGHFRDLVRLLRETILRAQSLPVTEQTVNAAIMNLRSSFLPIPLEDARWLDQIGQHRDSLLPDRESTSIKRMTLFLDTHCALILYKDKEWYDIHPIIREEVTEIVKRSTPPVGG
jgi:hypothetical protein